MIGYPNRLLSLALLGAALSASAAMAAPMVYFGEDIGAGSAAAMPNSRGAQTNFLGQLSSFGVDGLEGVATPAGIGSTSSLTFGATGVTGALSAPITVRSIPFNDRFASEGSNYLDSSFNRRISFSTAVSAFGLFVIDANETDNDPALVTIGGVTLTPAAIDARPFDSVDGIFRIITERFPGVFELLFDGGAFPALDGSAMFVGIIDGGNPFTNIILMNGTSGLDTGFQDGFAFDELTVGLLFSPIPEPGTGVLIALGLVAAGLASRRRSFRSTGLTPI